MVLVRHRRGHCSGSLSVGVSWQAVAPRRESSSRNSMAHAAMSRGIKYTGFVANAKHMSWLQIIVDTTALRLIAQKGEVLYMEDMADLSAQNHEDLLEDADDEPDMEGMFDDADDELITYTGRVVLPPQGGRYIPRDDDVHPRPVPGDERMFWRGRAGGISPRSGRS